MSVACEAGDLLPFETDEYAHREVSGLPLKPVEQPTVLSSGKTNLYVALADFKE
jgi:hypothetical protein